MSLTAQEREAIVRLKIEKAQRAFAEMQANFDMGMYSTAANRLYYALFYASSALLIKNGYEAHTHNGTISVIGLHFIKNNILPQSYGKLLRDVLRLRQESDYDDYFDVDKEDIERHLARAREYITLVKTLVATDR